MSRASHALLWALVVISWAGASAPSRADLVFLANDSFEEPPFTCNTGFNESDGFAAKFTAAPGQYPFTIDRILVLGCGNEQDAYTFTIYSDNGAGVNPGPALHFSPNLYVLSGEGFNEISVSAETGSPLTVANGSVRVLLTKVTNDTPIGFGSDIAITPGRNFVRVSGVWQTAESAGIPGDWILRLGVLVATVSVDDSPPAVIAFLGSNEPNPFMGSTLIRFSLARAARVSMEIFDPSGRVVATPIREEWLEAGERQVEFDGRGLASGIYFYRMTANGFSTSRRMLLIR